MSGGTVGPELYKQVTDTIVAVRQMGRVSTEMDLTAEGKAASRFPSHAVILDAALAAATNSKTAPTSALAKIQRWSVAESKYKETTQQIKVWNHSESTGFAINTFGEARMIDGHYWFFGDCEAMKVRGS
jgi:hypothetical protein